MKIGILTFHRADNFGAVIQAYALQEYIKNLGHEVEIIDFRCKSIESHYQVFNPSILTTRKNIILTFKEYILRFADIKNRRTKHQKFNFFRNAYLQMSQPQRTIPCDIEYDCIIVGSDQVWNAHLTAKDKWIYLLKCPFTKDIKRVSYAASSERNGLKKFDRNQLETCLEAFSNISVREEFLKEDLLHYTSHKIQVCCDPTFLLPIEGYIPLITQNINKQKYILAFHMSPMGESLKFVKKFANSKKAQIFNVYGGFSVKQDSSNITNWGPIEMLNYIYHAEAVVTTSFHGLALSLILNKEVWVVDSGDNLRQKHLLKMLGLEERLINSESEYHGERINYERVNERIHKISEESKLFIANSL